MSFPFLVSLSCFSNLPCRNWQTGILISFFKIPRWFSVDLLGSYLAVLLAGVLVHAPESSRAPFCLSSTVRTFSSSSTSTSKHFHLELLKLWMEGFVETAISPHDPPPPTRPDFYLGPPTQETHHKAPAAYPVAATKSFLRPPRTRERRGRKVARWLPRARRAST